MHRSLKRQYSTLRGEKRPPLDERDEIRQLRAEFLHHADVLRSVKDRYVAIRNRQIRECEPDRPISPRPPQSQPTSARRHRPKAVFARGSQLIVGPFSYPVSPARIRARLARFGRIVAIDLQADGRFGYEAIVTFERPVEAKTALEGMNSEDPRARTFPIAAYPRTIEKAKLDLGPALAVSRRDSNTPVQFSDGEMSLVDIPGDSATT
jgi:hypothetical protein